MDRIDDNAFKLLGFFTAAYPPGEGQRHSLTINDDGLLQLTLMLGDRYWPFGFEPHDLTKPFKQLSAELMILVARTLDESGYAEVVSE